MKIKNKLRIHDLPLFFLLFLFAFFLSCDKDDPVLDSPNNSFLPDTSIVQADSTNLKPDSLIIIIDSIKVPDIDSVIAVPVDSINVPSSGEIDTNPQLETNNTPPETVPEIPSNQLPTAPPAPEKPVVLTPAPTKTPETSTPVTTPPSTETPEISAPVTKSPSSATEIPSNQLPAAPPAPEKPVVLTPAPTKTPETAPVTTSPLTEKPVVSTPAPATKTPEATAPVTKAPSPATEIPSNQLPAAPPAPEKPVVLTPAPATQTPAEVNTTPSPVTPTTPVNPAPSVPVVITPPPSPFIAHNIQDDLPKGFVKDGSVDYTTYIQSAINKYSELKFPGFPILINDKGLIIPSNRKITFLEGSELRLKPSSKSSYNIIKIDRVSNVQLIGPKIIGDRNKHLGTTGEWGNGIGIYSSTNVSIANARVFDCWGDGIYIGKNSIVSKAIVITNAYLRNNRRDGISVIAADGLTLDRMYAGYTNGTRPACGINLEPNNSTEELKNINIISPLTEYNEGHGIQLTIDKLYGSSNKEIDITITKHTDIGSFYAFKVSNLMKSTGGHLAGVIKTIDPKWNLSTSCPLWMSQTDPELKVYITRPQIAPAPGTAVYKYTSIEKQLKYGLKSVSIPYILAL
ncbi:hypothetical protein [Rubrolithibacter danxiaensis]|uniref:right-handed parallel beta-helix repeat-containing protein n=1 Tax=Rubrolithibacter danxiaensis TaxID=3390805 RepID=UPI003BF81440